MKKLLALFTILLVASASLMAQERTVTINMGDNTYWNYTGAAADTLKPTTQDTIDVVFIYKGPSYVRKVAIKTRYDMITTADTTVKTSLYGKEFADDATYVEIIAVTASGAVTANNTVHVLASDWTETFAAYTMKQDTAGFKYYPADSIKVGAQTVTPLDKSYRYYRIRYILSGNDATGTGILIDDIELKLYTD